MQTHGVKILLRNEGCLSFETKEFLFSYRRCLNFYLGHKLLSEKYSECLVSVTYLL